MQPILLVLLSSSISFISLGQTAQDKESVRRVVLAFQQDFNRGDFHNAAAYTTPDWEHINPGGGITKGRQEVLQEVRGVHQTFLKGVSMRIESISIRFITPEVALADVIHELSPYDLPEGVKHEREQQLKTYVMVKQKGKWLLTHDHNTIIKGK